MPRKSKRWKRHFEEGMAKGAASRFPEAEASFREAVALAPDEPYPHYELGYTLALVGRYDEAMAEFVRTEELRRGFFLVQTEIYLCSQVLDGRLDGEMVDAVRMLQRLTDMGSSQGERAAELARRVIERAPECALGHFFLGKAQIAYPTPQAMESLRRCVELEPDDTTAIDARGHIGVLLWYGGKVEEARAEWRRIVEDYPDNPHIEMVQMMLGGGS
jgi:Flp pilus assembly protein TadD